MSMSKKSWDDMMSAAFEENLAADVVSARALSSRGLTARALEQSSRGLSMRALERSSRGLSARGLTPRDLTLSA
jgi:hypothetical protein